MKKDTSWESVGSWYDKIVGSDGSYYHRAVVLPNTLRLLALKKGLSLLDLGCGNGVLARSLPKGIDYLGVDNSPQLIKKAKSYTDHSFTVGDVTNPLPFKKKFDRIVFLLSLQNMEDLQGALQTAQNHAKSGSELLIVLNHPCFRIPRQSSWIIDREKKMQSRRIDAYLTPMKIPIQMHPSKKSSSLTYSFHRSLSDYTKTLYEMGFCILQFEEWVSEKQSEGSFAKMENRARKNFPLFAAFLAKKI